MTQHMDLRRKLEPIDYQLIAFYGPGVSNSSTIRELGSEFRLSTKYVKKIITSGQETRLDSQTQFIGQFSCSSCTIQFKSSGSHSDHIAFWNSDNSGMLCATPWLMAI